MRYRSLLLDKRSDENICLKVRDTLNRITQAAKELRLFQEYKKHYELIRAVN